SRRKSRAKPPRWRTLYPSSGGPPYRSGLVVLQKYVSAELSQTGEEESCLGERKRCKSVRHVEMVTGRAELMLCFMEAWIWM
ncbi:MAG: hypothetical protein Q9212_002280, partial [Teloschistes hypoglaucus]